MSDTSPSPVGCAVFRRDTHDADTPCTPPTTAGSSAETVSTNDEDARRCDEWELFSDFEQGAQPIRGQESRCTTANSYATSPANSPRNQLTAVVDDGGGSCGASERAQDCAVFDRLEDQQQDYDDYVDSEDTKATQAASARDYADGDSLDVSQEFDSRCEQDLDDPATSDTDRDALTPETPNARILSSARSVVSTPKSSSAQLGATTSRIHVYVRIRPQGRGESDADMVVRVQDATTLCVTSMATGSVTQSIVDQVFTDQSTQEDVFSAVHQSVRAALEGMNATVFAYGQTGTGKTYTMFGDDTDVQLPSSAGCEGDTQDDQAPSGWGLIPRALWILCTTARSGSAASSTQLSCSFVQIYNDRVFDLLTDRKRQKPLVLREQPTPEGGTNVVLQGLSSEPVASFSDALQIVRRGRMNRSVRETELNATSSRSHAIVQINVSIEETLPNGSNRIRTSRLNLVDLAGSEKWNTDVEMEDHHAAELKNINTSLSALGNCIAALAETGRRHIPYRDSTLTRLLQDSFGGNTLAYLIATISPSRRACDETIRTLQFADRARSVMQVVRVNESFSGNSELLAAKAHIKALRERLSVEQRRRHETRIKEHEALQRDFAAKLQEKEDELVRIRRDNEVFTKWREEDIKRIRMLEARIKEVENNIPRDEQMHPVVGSRFDDPKDNQKSAEETFVRPEDTHDGKTLTKKKSMRMRKNQGPDAKLPHVVNEQGRKTRQSYRSLIDKYSHSRKEHPAAGQRDSAKPYRPPSPVQKDMEQHYGSISPSDSSSPQKRAQLLRSTSDTLFATMPQVLAVSSGSSQYADSSTVSNGPTCSTMAELKRQPAAQTQFPTMWKTESLPVLTKQDPVPSGVYAQPQLSYPSVVPNPTRSYAPKEHTGTPAWSLPLVQSIGPSEPASVATTTQVCRKHNLKGCVLCAASELQPNPTTTFAACKSSPSLVSSTVSQSPRGVVDARQSPCERHQLPGCFICTKPTSDSTWRIPVSYGVGSASSSLSNSSSPLSEPVAASYRPAPDTKCSTHMLMNCVLCAGTNSRVPVAAPPSSLDSLASPTKRSSPLESAAWRSNQMTTMDRTLSNGTTESLYPSSMADTRGAKVDLPYFPASFGSSMSPIVRHVTNDSASRKQFNALVREASDAANVALRRRA